MNEVPFIIMSTIREQKKETTRRKLIEAATAEFAEVGYARANVTRISQKAGFAAGTVYNYFRSKHELLVAVVEHAMEVHTESIKREIGKLDDPVDKVKRAVQMDFQFMQQNESLGKVIVREGFAADPQNQKEFLGALAPASEIFAEILEQGKREGRFRADLDPVWTTVLASGMVAYLLLVRWALEDTGMTYEQTAELAIKCFVEGILAKGTTG
jgi:TetR/AcrR family fatty acid metabolism transcriptional regulator